MMDSVPMLAIICALLLVTSGGAAQNAPPLNDRANPYALVRNWPQLPEGRTLGAVSGVDVDRDGSSIWIAIAVAAARAPTRRSRRFSNLTRRAAW